MQRLISLLPQPFRQLPLQPPPRLRPQPRLKVHCRCCPPPCRASGCPSCRSRWPQPWQRPHLRLLRLGQLPSLTRSLAGQVGRRISVGLFAATQSEPHHKVRHQQEGCRGSPPTVVANWTVESKSGASGPSSHDCCQRQGLHWWIGLRTWRHLHRRLRSIHRSKSWQNYSGSCHRCCCSNRAWETNAPAKHLGHQTTAVWQSGGQSCSCGCAPWPLERLRQLQRQLQQPLRRQHFAFPTRPPFQRPSGEHGRARFQGRQLFLTEGLPWNSFHSWRQPQRPQRPPPQRPQQLQ